jgi:hypothetical protein
MENFTSGTQYGDIKGNITMDEQHAKGLHAIATANGVNINVDFPIAFDLYIGENDFVNLSVYTVERNNNDYETAKELVDNNDPIPVKKVDINISVADFFKHFKRINITASPMDGVIGKDYTII